MITEDQTYVPTSRPRVLVIGARPGSLGDALARVAPLYAFDPYTLGLHDEAMKLDVVSDSMDAMRDVFLALQPLHVICTVGLNVPQPDNWDLNDWYRWHFETNVTGPMRLLEAFLQARREYALTEPRVSHYVAVSSNSAHLPRTRSAAYCASKAALSMALRVKGREASGGDHGHVVYGYEPGLLAGTPMTADVINRLSGPVPAAGLTRMRGERLRGGIDPVELATFMVSNLSAGVALNGTLIPYDADEL